MHERPQDDYRTTLEAFHAFVDDRPESEKWELIDGEIVLNPAPTNRHQIVVRNLLFELESIRRSKSGRRWNVVPGIGARVPADEHNEPIPDVMVVPKTSDIFNWTYDILVAFEVLSPFSVRRDMVHKRAFYTRIESLTHYVVVAQERREATVFARANSFEAKILKSAKARIDLSELGVSISLADIYRDAPLG